MFKNLFLNSTSLIIGIFLLLFLVIPIAQVFYVSFLDVNGSFTLVNFSDFLRTNYLSSLFIILFM